MKGFRIKFRGETIDIAPAFEVSILVFQRNNHSFIQVIGLEESEELIACTWLDSNMNLGEELEIEIKDLTSSTEPVIKRKAFSDSCILTDEEIKEMFIEQLDRFHVLEKLLKEEGMID